MVRPSGVRFAVLVLLVTAGTAAAHPPPPPPDDEIDWRDDRALFEWSTWMRLGFGVERTPVDSIARSTLPPQLHDQHTVWDAALGADLTLPLPTAKVRLGPWIELRPQGVFGGGEVSIAGDDLDLFWYRGERVYSLRAGSSMNDITGAFAFGYRCPWKLAGPYNRTTRYMIGVRIVASATRSIDDPEDFSMSLGLEFEPVGSLRYVAGIRSWY
ncbi:MAG: hypothetical protein HOV81_30660 [Kofleriaceae bacterium]|nr:hypothetical protein [Kofleriaceae bacterium]